MVTRKVWGGDRTCRGAHKQSILVEHSPNLPSATPLPFVCSPTAHLCSSAPAFGLNRPYALNNYRYSSCDQAIIGFAGHCRGK